MFRYLVFASVAGLIAAGPAFAQYDKAGSAKAAENLGQDAAALAPQVPADQAVNPQGPTKIASAPVPDTKANRAKYGGPMSRAGRATKPIGD
jgi:hypothetical protein